MSVSRYQAPNFTQQVGTEYTDRIERAFHVGERLALWFHAHEQNVGSPSPDMTVRLEAGHLWDEATATLSEVAAQTVTGFTIPASGEHRIDRVVVDRDSGAARRIAGTPASGSPSAVAPAIPENSIPICRVLLTSADTAISNQMITDERPFGWGLPVVAITISANDTDYDLYAAAGSPTTPVHVRVTINSGIYVTSTAIATPAFDVGTGWAVGSRCTITNNGYILGKGGAGASWNGSSLVASENGGDGLALRADLDVSINNGSGVIAGGGGGGGAILAQEDFGSGLESYTGAGGGGAGGGTGGTSKMSSSTRAGGAGGAAGAEGSDGASGTIAGSFMSGAGGGGRIAPGTGGAGATASVAAQGGQAGGGGGACYSGGGGGAGGTDDAAGTAATSNKAAGGGGGGYGASGGAGAKFTTSATVTTRAAGTGGKAVALNGQTVTWLAEGTRYGAIS